MSLILTDQIFLLHFAVLFRRLHGLASVGDMVAFESSVEVFNRAKVLKVTRVNERNEAKAVNIRLIDNGQYRNDVSVSIYSLDQITTN